MDYPKDYLDACRRAGSDPKELRTREEIEAYMRAWAKVGERIQKMKRHLVRLEKNSLLRRQAG